MTKILTGSALVLMAAAAYADPMPQLGVVSSYSDRGNACTAADPHGNSPDRVDWLLDSTLRTPETALA